ncbi:MAG: hypothetical protein AAF514_06025 [Verrucomicrobiota bacterium]
MDWITDNLLIGNYLDARDIGLLRRHGIRSMVSLDGSLHGVDYSVHGIEAVATIDFIDGPGNEPQV